MFTLPEAIDHLQLLEDEGCDPARVLRLHPAACTAFARARALLLAPAPTAIDPTAAHVWKDGLFLGMLLVAQPLPYLAGLLHLAAAGQHAPALAELDRRLLHRWLRQRHPAAHCPQAATLLQRPLEDGLQCGVALASLPPSRLLATLLSA